MSLELLSNELFLDIFEYLSTVHLLEIFSDLNQRLTNLLAFHLQTHPCSFQSSSKYHFDLVCQKYLPILFDRISSLRLSDDHHTPNQIKTFFTYGFSLRQFNHLTSLSIHQLSSLTFSRNILDEYPQLTHLNITRCVIQFHQDYDIRIIDWINRLPKLVSCHLDITHDNEQEFSIPAIHSSSLKYLSLPFLECTVCQLLTLIAHIPRLQWIKVRISDSSKLFPTMRNSSFPSIKTLKLTFDGSFLAINYLLSTMMNLEILQIHMPSSYINGYQWEELINKQLSNLKVFQFQMFTYTKSRKTREEEIELILQSFQSSFWLEHHHWFVQCYYSTLITSSIVNVHTLPYAFSDLYYLDDALVKSTSSIKQSFNHVHNLYLDTNLSTQGSPIDFNGIQYLFMSIPCNDLLQSIVSKFDRLETLQILLCDSINPMMISKLQRLLDQMKHLHSFGLTSWIDENHFPIQLKHSSIRQLDLRGLTMISYSDRLCEQLIQSTIVQQCQILFLRMHQSVDILQFIQRLSNLQSLIIKCQNELTRTMMIKYLEDNSFSSSIIPNTDEIRLWLR